MAAEGRDPGDGRLVLDGIAKLLHPFMPFLTEELWAIKGEEGRRARPPGAGALAGLDGLADAEAEAEIGWLVDLVTEIRSARSETNVPAGAQIPLGLVGRGRGRAGARRALGRHAASASPACRRSPSRTPRPGTRPARGARRASRPCRWRASSTSPPSARACRRRSPSGRARSRKIDAKLGNADFLARAPEEVVEEQRERRDAEAARLARIREALARLSDH